MCRYAGDATAGESVDISTRSRQCRGFLALESSRSLAPLHLNFSGEEASLAERVQRHEGLERKDEKTKDEQHREDEQRSRVLLLVLGVEACFEPAKYFRCLILAIHDPLVILSIPPLFPN